MTAIVSSNTIRYSSDAYTNLSACSYTKFKELLITDNYTGSWTISFYYQSAYGPTWDEPGDIYLRIYKNGVPYGTERYYSGRFGVDGTQDETFNNISVRNGDLIQLYGYTCCNCVGCNCITSGDYPYGATSNFRIKFDSVIPPWLSGWNYRKSKVINGSTAGAQTDYQMKLTVYKGIGTDTTDIIYLNNHIKDDFSDLRFTGSDQITLLNYWIESYISGESATVWVKVPNIPVSPNTTIIYIYYYNPIAISASNGTNTFDVFDDFEGGTVGQLPSGWTRQSEQGYNPVSSVAVSNDSVNPPSPPNTVKITSSNQEEHLIKSGYTFTNGTIELNIRTDVSNSNPQRAGIVFRRSDAGNFYRAFPYVDGSVLASQKQVGGGWSNLGTWPFKTYTTSTWYKLKVITNGNSFTISTDGTSFSFTDTSFISGSVGICMGYASTQYVDNFFIHKYASPEPTFSTSGIEETTCTPTCWLNGWNKRKSKTINGASTAQTDFQMKFTVYKGSGADAADVVYLPNVNNDFSDIRFTDSDGATPLNYWIETYTPSSVATVWVKIPNIPASPGSTIIYIYYGNICISTASSGTNTFALYDDFIGTNGQSLNTSRWTVYLSPSYNNGNSASIQNNQAQLVAHSSTYAAFTYSEMKSTTNFNFSSTGVWIQMYYPSPSGSPGAGGWFSYAVLTDSTGTEWNPSNQFGIRAYDSQNPHIQFIRIVSGITTVLLDYTPVNRNLAFFIYGSTATLYELSGNNWVQKWTGSSGISFTSGYLEIADYSDQNYGLVQYLDNIIIRKYVSPGPTYGAWGIEETAPTIPFLTGWTRRKLKTINGTITGPQSNYQMKFTIYKGTGSDSTDIVYCGNSVKDDFSDIRFTLIDGTTLLDYWAESYVSATSAIVWVEIPYIPKSPDSTQIYFYYNNPTATSLSNGTNTFIFYDHFEGSSYDATKWHAISPYSGGSISVSNSIITVTGGASQYQSLAGLLQSTTDTVTEMKLQYSHNIGPITSVTIYAGLTDEGLLNYANSIAYSTAYHRNAKNSTESTATRTIALDGTYHKLNIVRNGSTNIQYIIDGITDATISTNIPTVNLEPVMMSKYNTNWIKMDYIFIRKYATAEPTFGSWCLEESICNPIHANITILEILSEQLLDSPPGCLDPVILSIYVDNIINN